MGFGAVDLLAGAFDFTMTLTFAGPHAMLPLPAGHAHRFAGEGFYGDRGDRGYDSNEFRRELKGNNNEPVIPGRKNRREKIACDKRKYKKCGLIERIFGKLKENRRLTVRHEKSDINFLRVIFIAFLKILLC